MKDLPQPGHAMFLSRVRDVLHGFMGRGSKDDKLVSVADLRDAGLIATLGDVFTPGPAIDPTPDLTPPPTPTGLAVTAGMTNLIIECDPALYTQGHGHDRTIVYGASRVNVGDPKPTFASAVELTSFQGTVFAHPVRLGVFWHIWIKWRSNDGVLSASPAGGTNGFEVQTGKVGNSDLNDAIITSQKLASGAVDALDKFLPGLEPITIVSALPATSGYAGSKLVFLTTDGKLYRFVSGAWVRTVPTTDLTGTVTDAQIAGMAASKVTGQLTNAQLADIAAAKVTGQLTDAQIAGLAAAKVTGQLSDAQLAGIAAAKITGQIVGTQITDGSVSTPKLAAGAVTAGKIAAGTITANEIAASTIVASRLVLSNQDSVHPDPGFFDPAWWHMPTGVVAQDNSTNWPVARAMVFTTGVAGAALDYMTEVFPIELGATYRFKVTIFVEAAYNGQFAVNAHFPGQAFFDMGVPRSGTIGSTGLGAVNVTRNTWLSYTSTFTNASGAIGGTTYPNYSQFRFVDSGHTAGNVYVVIEMVRASSADLIVDGAVVASKIAAGAVTAGKIAADAVTANEIAANAVTSAELAAGAVIAGKLAAGAVTAGTIAAGAVTAGTIDANAVTANEIAAGAVTASELSAGAVVAGKLAASAIVAGDGVIANAAITNALIANLAVDNAKIASLAVSKLTGGTMQVGAFVQSTNYVAGTSGFNIPASGAAEFSGVTVRGTVVATAGSIGGININSTGIFSSNWTGVGEGGTGFFIQSNGALHASEVNLRGSINSGGFTGYAWPAAGKTGYHLSSAGLLLGNATDRGFFQIEAATGNVYAGGSTTGTQFQVVGGAATFSGALSAASGTFAGSLSAATGTFSGTLTAQVVQTTNIVGGAVTNTYTATGSTTCSVTTATLPAGATALIIHFDPGTSYTSGSAPSGDDEGGTLGSNAEDTAAIVVNGTTVRTQQGVGFHIIQNPSAAAHTITLNRTRSLTNSARNAQMIVQVAKR